MPKIIIQFQGQEWSVELKEGSNTIGRSSSCTIPVRDTSMSREHCEIQVQGGVATLIDKGSMNGTLLNGDKVLERQLNPGDEMQVGAATVWFQEKGAGGPEGDVRPSPQPSSAAEEPRARSGKRESRSRAAALAMLKDYSQWGRDRAFPLGAVIGAIVIIVLAGVGVFAAGLLGGPARKGEVVDPSNMVANPGFETSDQIEWQLPTGAKSRLSIDASSPRRGKSALLLEKSGESSELLVEATGSEQGLGDNRRIQLSAWAKADGFGGNVALKVNWLTGVRGSVLLEEYSTPVARPESWSQLSGTFSAPANATAFSAALCAIGRSGRVMFDDVRLAADPGEAVKPVTLGSWDVGVGPTGAFSVGAYGRRLLGNVHLALISDKEGTSRQTIAMSASHKDAKDAIAVEGALHNPVDMREVAFRQDITVVDGDLEVKYTLIPDHLRQIDRVVVAAGLLQNASVSGIPAEKDAKTVRVVLRGDQGPTVLEYAEPIRVALTSSGGSQAIVQTFPIDRAAASVVIALRIRAGAGAQGETDPLRAAQELERKGDSAGALGLLQEALAARVARDPSLKQRMLAEVQRLQEQEKREWNEVQAGVFKASISRRPEVVDESQRRTGAYAERWGRGPFADKLKPVRAEMDQLAGQVGVERDEERAKRLLERARFYATSGRRALAAEVCETLLSRYGGTEAAREAKEVLEGLGGQ